MTDEKIRRVKDVDAAEDEMIDSYQLAVAQQDTSHTYHFDLMPAILKANQQRSIELQEQNSLRIEREFSNQMPADEESPYRPTKWHHQPPLQLRDSVVLEFPI